MLNYAIFVIGFVIAAYMLRSLVKEAVRDALREHENSKYEDD